MFQIKRTFLILAMAGCISGPVLAERADREKPVNVEADKITVDDVNKVHQFDGKVQMTQGTLTIRAERIVVTQDAAGNQKGLASGGVDGLATFRQKREGKDEYVEGEAERIEHDSSSEKTELFGRASVKSGQDRVRGQYISFDARTENYLVTNGDGRKGSARSGERVRAVIQPRAKSDADKAPPARTTATAAQ
jgi:lipopolysaccharide export system protein LptA